MKIDIQIEDHQVLAAFNELIRRGDDLTPAMREISGLLEEAAQRAFAEEADPATGNKWAPLSPVTVKFRGGDAHPILQRSGGLSAIQSDYGRNHAAAGTNKVYGPMQQFGGTTSPNSMIPDKVIPARPYLGIGPRDKLEILDVLQRFIADGYS